MVGGRLVGISRPDVSCWVVGSVVVVLAKTSLNQAEKSNGLQMEKKYKSLNCRQANFFCRCFTVLRDIFNFGKSFQNYQFREDLCRNYQNFKEGFPLFVNLPT